MSVVEIALACVCLLLASGFGGFLVFLSIRQSVLRKRYVARLNDHDKSVIADYMQILW